MVGLAAQKRHISVYINAAMMTATSWPRYKDRLGKAKVGSASIGFKSLADIDLGVLMELVDMAASRPPIELHESRIPRPDANRTI